MTSLRCGVAAACTKYIRGIHVKNLERESDFFVARHIARDNTLRMHYACSLITHLSPQPHIRHRVQRDVPHPVLLAVTRQAEADRLDLRMGFLECSQALGAQVLLSFTSMA